MLNATPLPPISEFTPHQGTMLLLSRVVEMRPLGFTAEAEIRPGLFLADADGSVGGWVGIEYMAQTIAAWAGWQARRRGEPIKIGLLVGTRKYHSHRSRFLRGEVLLIDVEQIFKADNGIGSFECTIRIAGEPAAEAVLTVFEPPNVDEYLGD